MVAITFISVMMKWHQLNEMMQEFKKFNNNIYSKYYKYGGIWRNIQNSLTQDKL